MLWFSRLLWRRFDDARERPFEVCRIVARFRLQRGLSNALGALGVGDLVFLSRHWRGATTKS
jgi:hypothetical protein